MVAADCDGEDFSPVEDWTPGECDRCAMKNIAPKPSAPFMPVCACSVGAGASANACACR